MYYVVCPQCGAHLAPGERCSCSASHRSATQAEENELRAVFNQLSVDEQDRLVDFVSELVALNQEVAL